MGAVKRWLDELQEQAGAGDEAARQTLTEAGLWCGDETAEEAEAAAFAASYLEGGQN